MRRFAESHQISYKDYGLVKYCMMERVQWAKNFTHECYQVVGVPIYESSATITPRLRLLRSLYHQLENQLEQTSGGAVITEDFLRKFPEWRSPTPEDYSLIEYCMLEKDKWINDVHHDCYKVVGVPIFEDTTPLTPRLRLLRQLYRELERKLEPMKKQAEEVCPICIGG